MGEAAFLDREGLATTPATMTPPPPIRQEQAREDPAEC